MAELAVREALALAEEVIIILYQTFERPTNLHDDVEKVQNILEMMHECVRESEDGIDEDRQLFLDVAYRFEDALEEFMFQLVTDEALNNISQDTDDDGVAEFIGSWKPSCKLSSDIEEIIDKNTSFVERLDSLLQNHISEGGSRSRLGDSFTFSYHDLAEGDQVVGFGELQEKLFKQLTEEDSKLLTIFIVGPGGSGKSTLVKNVFKSEEVQRFFDCKAWVVVPRQPLQLNELLLKMLTGLEEKPALVEQVVDPKAKLRLFLQQKRYLVVLDDVWRKQDLQYIVKALPNGFHGSRIIITSRNSDVASFLSPKYIHDLSSGLSSERAKDLFFSKAFHNNERYLCPPELEECSRKILKWCGGLPLAISEVGTLLAEKPRNLFVWDKFRQSLGTEIRPGSSLSIISSILEPSYMDLPNHLKTCFLYLGVFPAYYHIQFDRLIHLWVAEGFVKPTRGITVEQVAQGYLNELIERNLVLIVSERGITWRRYEREPSCYVVNLVRDFIISKAENFITVLEPNCSTSTSGERIRRLSVHAGSPQLLRSGLDLKHIRTLLVFFNYSHTDLETVLRTSKFLRVIDLKDIPYFIHFHKSVDGLILLKYASLMALGTVPKSLRKLRFLETLELGRLVEELPEEICQLYTLRHLLVYPSRGVKFSAGNIGALSSMQGLAMINVSNDRKIIKALGELKDLRKLGVVELETKDGKELCIALEKMKHLSTLDVSSERGQSLDLDHMHCPPLYLQHLYLSGTQERLPMWISKLTSLQKLHLKRSVPNANPLDVLEALPNLMELYLKGNYRCEELVFRADTFKKLMNLNIKKIYGLNLMRVEDGALPMLRELSFSNCPYLKSLPYGFGGLKSLHGLVLEDMPDEFIAMLRKDGPCRQEVRHIPVIRSYKSGRLSQDLSENASSSSGGHDGKMSSNDKLYGLKNLQDSAGISVTNKFEGILGTRKNKEKLGNKAFNSICLIEF
ncbi:hypothetical protein M0R45_003364 [Rubus argutus]|uniref:Uncharacterized protein n=1 Tax=Rubus argutus TaxID=59490 RepID=A0AAW1YHL5_RUBAR